MRRLRIRVMLTLAVLISGAGSYLMGDFYYYNKPCSYLDRQELKEQYLSEAYMNRYPSIGLQQDRIACDYIKAPVIWLFRRDDGIIDGNRNLHAKKASEIPVNKLNREKPIQICTSENLKIVFVGRYFPPKNDGNQAKYSEDNLLFNQCEFFATHDQGIAYYYIQVLDKKKGIMEYYMGVEL